MRAMVINAVVHHRTGKLSMESFKPSIKEQGLFSQSRFLSLPNDGDSIFKRSCKLQPLKEAEEYLISEAPKSSMGNQGIAAFCQVLHGMPCISVWKEKGATIVSTKTIVI